jgi:histone H3/H4
MAKKKKKAKKAKKGEMLIKKSLVQEYIKSRGDFRVSAESFEALSERVMNLCDEAMDRAEINRRKTVQKQDF